MQKGSVHRARARRAQKGLAPKAPLKVLLTQHESKERESNNPKLVKQRGREKSRASWERYIACVRGCVCRRRLRSTARGGATNMGARVGEQRRFVCRARARARAVQRAATSAYAHKI